MSARPLNTAQIPREVIDDLVANFGLRRVLFAVLTRIFRRTRPPDPRGLLRLARQPGVDELSDHLRRDLGLPPDNSRTIKVDLLTGFYGRHM